MFLFIICCMLFCDNSYLSTSDFKNSCPKLKEIGLTFAIPVTSSNYLISSGLSHLHYWTLFKIVSITNIFLFWFVFISFFIVEPLFFFFNLLIPPYWFFLVILSHSRTTVQYSLEISLHIQYMTISRIVYDHVRKKKGSQNPFHLHS